jgi:hypothetical protein
MPIDIGGAFTISGASGSQALKIAGTADGLVIDTTGRSFTPNQPGFNAGLTTDPGWVAQPADTWVYQNYFNNTTYNKGYASNRFTAPVAGRYWFHVYSYHNKASSTAGTGWVYAQVYINGVAVGPHQIIGHPNPASHSYGAEQAIVLNMAAGDYADMYIYASGAGTNCYRRYSGFEGYLVG